MPAWATDPSTILTLLNVVGLLVSAAVVIRSSYLRSSLELLRGHIGDLEKRKTYLEATHTSLTKEVEVLRELVTSRADVQAVAARLDELTQLVRDQHAALLDALDDRQARRTTRRGNSQ